VGRANVKRWLLVIRCATIGAVPFKMMDTMDTSSFLLALEQFLALRPRPSVIIADNGSNFKGAEAALKEKTESDQIDLEKAQSHFNIKFRFAPPRSPHHMGLVERFVQSAKAAIHSATNADALSDEELRTVFSRAMGHLNDVPIAYMVKSDANFHYTPLTPGHFLMGAAYSEL
jgi:transposase InsO family protein